MANCFLRSKYALSGCMEIHLCNLQDIGPLGPLPCSHSNSSADHSKQGIGYHVRSLDDLFFLFNSDDGDSGFLLYNLSFLLLFFFFSFADSRIYKRGFIRPSVCSPIRGSVMIELRSVKTSFLVGTVSVCVCVCVCVCRAGSS